MKGFSTRVVLAALLLACSFTAISFPARAGSDPVYRAEIEGTWKSKDGKTLTFARKEAETAGGAAGLTMTQTNPAKADQSFDWEVSYLDGREYMVLKRVPKASELDSYDTLKKRAVPDWAKEKITQPGESNNYRLEWVIKSQIKRGDAGLLGVLGDRCDLTMSGKATYGQWDWDEGAQKVWSVGTGPNFDIQEYSKVRYDLPQLASPPLQLANISWDGDDAAIDFEGKAALMDEVYGFMQERAIYTYASAYLKTMFDAILSAIPGESIIAKIAEKVVQILGDVFLSEDGFQEFVKGVTGEIFKALIGKAPDIMKAPLEKLADKTSDKAGDKGARTVTDNLDTLSKYLSSQCAIKIVALKPPPKAAASKKTKAIGGIGIVDTVLGTARVRLFLGKNDRHPPTTLEAVISGLPEKGKEWDMGTHIAFHRIPM